MAKKDETTKVQEPVFLEVGKNENALIWRQMSGVFRSFDDPDRIVRVGLPGMTDAGMILKKTVTPEMVGQEIGLAVQVEFKTKDGRQTKKQRDWQKAVESVGGRYVVVRSVDDMQRFIDGV